MADAAQAADGSIRVDRLGVTYPTQTGPLEALRGIDLTIASGEFVGVVGSSGCGKTTLLRTIGGLVRPSQGEVRIAGRPADAVRRDRKIGFVFQRPALLPWRTVWGNVRLPLEIIGDGPAGRGPADERIGALLEMMGLSRFKDNYPHELSGGMQQRVAIARALSFDPAILLMDEPFGSLDEITRDRLNMELLRVWHERPHTIVFVTHSTREAVLLSDRIVVLSPWPGTVAAVLDVDLPRPRDMDMRYGAEFMGLAQKVNRLLHHE